MIVNNLKKTRGDWQWEFMTHEGRPAIVKKFSWGLIHVKVGEPGWDFLSVLLKGTTVISKKFSTRKTPWEDIEAILPTIL